MDLSGLVWGSLLASFGYDPTFLVLVMLVCLIMLLTFMGASKGLLFVSLIGFVSIFVVVAPAINWLLWLLVLAAVALILIGLKIFFSRIF